MGQGVYKITDEFEAAVARYAGAPYCCALDNGSNALFLALKWWGVKGQEIRIPAHTYPSVPCEIIHAGGRVAFDHAADSFGRSRTIRGPYRLLETPVWDSALRFTADMYLPGSLMCLSFTGPYKHLKLGKGGAILTGDAEANAWFRRKRYSGRRECSYHEDWLDQLGWNFYMMPEIAARGLLLMNQFYGPDGERKHNPDIELPYPDLSRFSVYAPASRRPSIIDPEPLGEPFQGVLDANREKLYEASHDNP